jgi:hypothetical protein
MKKIALIFVSAFTLFCMILCGNQNNEPEQTNLLFSYFKGNGEDGLHFAYSHDRLNWKTVKNDESFLTPSVGKDKLMRDPCIAKGPDNLFHMVWTVSWHEQGIGYANSPDLINWSPQKYIPVMEHEPDANNCWAPELFWDEATKQYLIFWATTIPGRFPETDIQGAPDNIRNHRMYYTTTKDFETFTETEIYYDHGFNVIDASLYTHNNKYVMLLKDETDRPLEPEKNICIAYADKAVGPYSEPSEPIHGEYWAEGPTMVKIGDIFYVYFDRYRLHSYGLAVSSDLENWQDWSDKLTYPDGMRHGTVFKVNDHILEQLLTQ